MHTGMQRSLSPSHADDTVNIWTIRQAINADGSLEIVKYK